MAAVKITINGVICDMYGRTISGPVKIVGEAMYSDRGVGGGPLPGGGAPVDPGYGYPEYPVDPGYGVPERPRPPSDAHPEHPIVLPPDEPPPTNPPDSDGFLKPPPEGGWGYHQVYGWLYNPAEGVAAPKA